MCLSGLPEGYDATKYAEQMEDERIRDDFFGVEKETTSAQGFVLSNIEKLNADQYQAFRKISGAVLGTNKQRLFFLEGAGGCGMLPFIFIFILLPFFIGKTFLYNTIIRWILAGKPLPEAESLVQGPLKLDRGSVISAASTGIAALLLIGGATVQ